MDSSIIYFIKNKFNDIVSLRVWGIELITYRQINFKIGINLLWYLLRTMDISRISTDLKQFL